MADGSTSSPQGDLKNAIKHNAEGPKQAGADGVNVQQHAIADQIPASRCSGSTIRVSGITGNIRGALHTRADGTQVRRTLVVYDDPRTDRSARSIPQTTERLDIVNGAISGLAGPGERTVRRFWESAIRNGLRAKPALGSLR